jgi:hypothetical protein
VVGHSELSSGDNEFVDVFGDLDERGFSGNEGIKIFHTIFNSWDQELEFTDKGIISIFFSFSGGVDVDELSVVFF